MMVCMEVVPSLADTSLIWALLSHRQAVGTHGAGRGLQ